MTDLSARIANHFEESGRLKLELAELLATPIANAAEIIVQALLNEKKVLACGNGGSASSAQYFASRMLNRYEMERPGLAAIALPADIATLTSIANDNHFEQVFSRQISALGHHGDVLLALSTSGNSKNILHAITAAKESGLSVIAFSGGDGGGLVELLGEDDIHIGVPHENPARIQEVYILTLHCICDAIDCLLLGVN
ncbi:SIS domain-containing protein [Methylobacillus gramineus]|uniref:SIS domain-containing protein n=1 Tax=Methylobacillus gramineus TaxID=755169 RepID=UPI001CFFB9A6|nr:SIS domain-containing protein [Methylobacillus gramineus]MCB5186190.1 SIS domain-containing protein [Methylobacillus gramineus]